MSALTGSYPIHIFASNPDNLQQRHFVKLANIEIDWSGYDWFRIKHGRSNQKAHIVYLREITMDEFNITMHFIYEKWKHRPTLGQAVSAVGQVLP